MSSSASAIFVRSASLLDSLGRRGIAVLRMDDRGTGASIGTFKRTTSAEFAEDIRAGLAYLRTRPEIDAARMGVMGHAVKGPSSAPMVADAEPSLRAIVLLAGVARPVRSALDMQMKNLINLHNDKVDRRRARTSRSRTFPRRVEKP